MPSPTKDQSPIEFDHDRASSYEERFAKVAPMRESLHFLMKRILAPAPENARILCVGAGSGLELINMAQENPGWTFTAVDPSEPMLDSCKKAADKAGVLDRITFHQDYLPSLKESQPFDAATSILVSHFILKPESRVEYFQEIEKRLKPNSYLVSADLSSDLESEEFKNLFPTWIDVMRFAGLPEEELETLGTRFREEIALYPPKQVADIIAKAGFKNPTLFYQGLLIRAWFAKKT